MCKRKTKTDTQWTMILVNKDKELEIEFNPAYEAYRFSSCDLDHLIKETKRMRKLLKECNP